MITLGAVWIAGAIATIATLAFDIYSEDEHRE